MTDEAVLEVKPLSEIFGGKPDPAPKADPVKVDDQKPEDKPVAEDGKGDKSGETPAPKAEEKKPDDPQQPKKDDPIKAMRKALSATQRELQQLRNEKQQSQAKPAPDPIADAEGYAKHLDQTISDRLWQERLADAHEDLSEKLGDAYEETLEAFTEMMKERPELYRDWRASRNPGKFLLKTVEDHRTQQEIGDPQKFAERIRAETRKEMMGEVEKLVTEGIKKALGQRLPQSLADEQTQGSSRTDEQPAEFRRKPLESILNKKR